MRHPYAVLRENWHIWKAGHDTLGLCSAWNHATQPSRLLTEREHVRAQRYARAIRNRMRRIGLTLGRDYIELSNGELWPILRR